MNRRRLWCDDGHSWYSSTEWVHHLFSQDPGSVSQHEIISRGVRCGFSEGDLFEALGSPNLQSDVRTEDVVVYRRQS